MRRDLPAPRHYQRRAAPEGVPAGAQDAEASRAREHDDPARYEARTRPARTASPGRVAALRAGTGSQRPGPAPQGDPADPHHTRSEGERRTRRRPDYESSSSSRPSSRRMSSASPSSLGFESGMRAFFPDPTSANAVTERAHGQYSNRDPHRLLRLELRALARRPLSAAGLDVPVARALRGRVRHCGDQCDLLPTAGREDGRGLGTANTGQLPFHGEGEPLPDAREAPARRR
jgi:hypothetical protein